MHKTWGGVVPLLAALAALLPAPALAARPVVSAIGNRSVVEGDALVVPVTATDVDGDTVVFSGVRLPGFCQVVDHGDNTADLTCHPTLSDDGLYPGLQVAARDPGGVVGRSSIFTLEVEDAGVSALRLHVILDKQTYDLSPMEPIRIAVRVENTGPDNLWLRDGLSAAALQYDLVFHDPLGHEVLARDMGRAAAGRVGEDGGMTGRGGEPEPPRMYTDLLGHPIPVEEVEEVGGTLDGGFAYELVLPDAHAYFNLMTPGWWAVEARYPTRSYPAASVATIKPLQVNRKRDFAALADGNPTVLHSQVVRFELASANAPPVLAYIHDQYMHEGEDLVLDVDATDPDGDATIALSVDEPLPGFCTFTDHAGGLGTLMCSPRKYDAGSYPITVRATDDHGASDTRAFTLLVKRHYKWGGFRPPLEEGRVCELGQTIPVKIDLTEDDGSPAQGAVVTLWVQMLDDGEPVGDPILVSSTSEADTDNTFRYVDGFFIYNLDTGPLHMGSYRLIAILDDGSSHAIDIGLKYRSGAE